MGDARLRGHDRGRVFLPLSLMSTVILFNKPFGVLSQFTPESGHAALDTFGFPPGVYAAGRLDHDSEGALLLTDNGKLIKKLLDPKFEHPRTYLAQVDGQITEALPNAMFQVQLDDGRSIVAYLSGKMRMYYVRIYPGDRVKVEMDESDSSRGRIVYRY